MDWWEDPVNADVGYIFAGASASVLAGIAQGGVEYLPGYGPVSQPGGQSGAVITTPTPVYTNPTPYMPPVYTNPTPYMPAVGVGIGAGAGLLDLFGNGGNGGGVVATGNSMLDQIANAGLNSIGGVGQLAGLITGFFNTGALGQAVKFLAGVFGSPWFKVIVGIASVLGIGTAILRWLKGGSRKKHRRYSIGSNPRIGTLVKVGRQVTKSIESYDKVANKFRTRTVHHTPAVAARKR